MKHIIKIIIFVFGLTASQAQNIEREVVSSAGGTITDGAITMDFTIGELAVTTITDGATTLTQGFQQGGVLLGVKVNPTVFLQGALLGSTDNLMRDDLRELYVPTTSPYSDALTCDVSVFTDGGTIGNGLAQDNIVDWVYVELRDKSDATLVKSGTSALLQRDGDVVGVDGLSNIELPVKADNYYVVVKHRNHLGVMSANVISLSDTVTNLDFTDDNNQITYGTNAQSTFGAPAGKVAMWAGNASGDTTSRYQGSSNDANAIKDNVLADVGNTSNSNLHQYFAYENSDVNMDSSIRYQGSGNDSNSIKDIILSHPDNQIAPSNLFVVEEQLPENN